MEQCEDSGDGEVPQLKEVRGAEDEDHGERKPGDPERRAGLGCGGGGGLRVCVCVCLCVLLVQQREKENENEEEGGGRRRDANEEE